MGRWIRYVGLTTQERTQEALCLLDDECIMAESTSPLLKMNLRVLYIQEAYRFTLGTNPCDTGCSEACCSGSSRPFLGERGR